MNFAQKIALAWARQTYGEVSSGRRYQAFRFLEEAMELAQAEGIEVMEMVKLAGYVNGREKGNTGDEIGDVRLTLDILAENAGFDSNECYVRCLERVSKLDVEKTRQKDKVKINTGFI